MMRSLIWVLAPLLAAGGTAAAENDVEPSTWGLATVADCEGPDGASFVTSVVSLPDGTIRFEQVHADRSVALLLVAGKTEQVHRRAGGTAAEWEVLPIVQAEFVRGHDVHRRFLESGSAGAVESAIPEAIGGGTVRLEFGDLRPVIDTELPYQVDFLHDGERFRSRTDCRVSSLPVSTECLLFTRATTESRYWLKERLGSPSTT